MEDLKVAKFYRDRGNFNAVYLRSKDAVKTIPDDPEAHLLLARGRAEACSTSATKPSPSTTPCLKFDPTDEQKEDRQPGAGRPAKGTSEVAGVVFG